MKKLSMLFSALAIVFAISSAFALKTNHLVQNGYIDGNGVCKKTESQCPGGSQTCQVDVPEEAASVNRQVGIFASSCTGLNMD